MPRDSPQLIIANILNDEIRNIVKVRLIGGPNVNIAPEMRAVKISVGSSRHVYCARKHVAVIHTSFRSFLKVSRSPGYTIMLWRRPGFESALARIDMSVVSGRGREHTGKNNS